MPKRMIIPILLALTTVTAQGATYRVDPSGGGTHLTLEGAFAVALTGDTILVAPGTYTGPENRGLVFGDRNLVIRAEGERAETIIDCQGESSAFILNEQQDPTSVIEGLTITGGAATQGGGVLIYNASATIRDCSFLENNASQGGGLFIQGYGQPGLVEGCEFVGNTSDYGAGLYASGMQSPDIENCSFIANIASVSGGGIFLQNFASPQVANCWIEDNEATQNGGGLFIQINSSPIVQGCTLVGNQAHFGGGAYVFSNSEPDFTLCTFALNRADGGGGAIYLFLNAHAGIEQNLFCWSEGGGMLACVGSTPIVTHNLSWESGTTTSFCGAYSDNLYWNPRFCGPIANRDFRLRSDSPCLPEHVDNFFNLHIGAWPTACGPEPAAASSWSEIKVRY